MKRLIHILYLIIIPIAGLYANDSTKIRSIFDDFYQPDQIVEVTLQFDCKQMIRQKTKQEKFPATIQYQRPDGEVITRSIQVKSRGKSRLNVCNFPPLKLDFYKDDLKKESFLEDADELKIVTHCTDNNVTDRQVLKELLVYKLYNIITEKSFNTQALRIKYLDKNGELHAEEYAFMIESTDALAARINCRKSERVIESISELDAISYNQMVCFEYMIGNVDWDIRARHNIEVLKSLNLGYRITIPYDFDYSGVVSAFYAVADDRVGQKYLGERVLFNNFTSENAFQATIKHFLDKEKAIFETCNNFTSLEEKDRTAVIKYLKSFFDVIKQPKINSKKFTTYGMKEP